jgi:hypothetical protein
VWVGAAHSAEFAHYRLLGRDAVYPGKVYRHFGELANAIMLVDIHGPLMQVVFLALAAISV